MTGAGFGHRGTRVGVAERCGGGVIIYFSLYIAFLGIRSWPAGPVLFIYTLSYAICT